MRSDGLRPGPPAGTSITPSRPSAAPPGNAVVERFIRTLKEELIWLQDWDSAADLAVAVAAWLKHYNTNRPHQALGWQTPTERRADRLAAPLQLAA